MMIGAIAMPIPEIIEEEDPEYKPHGDDIAERVVLFKQTELENWFSSLSVVEQETAYCLYTYPKPEGD